MDTILHCLVSISFYSYFYDESLEATANKANALFERM